MATIKKAVVKKAIKKAQYGTSTSMDSKGRYNVVTKSNTPEGPRYYQYAHPSESTATMFNAARARANSADSIPAAKVNPIDIKKLSNQKNGGKTMLKRKDGSTSQRGLWDNIRAAKGSGKKPTAAMLKQEKKIKAKNK